jgi:HTH-type transcriptional regulator/antitoxin HigA
MHEIGHLLLHYESKRTIISCEQDESSTASQETEANQFAETFFLDTTAYEAFCNNKAFSHTEVRAFAETQHVHPGIVVSLLQHDKLIPYSQLNTLKNKITLIEA